MDFDTTIRNCILKIENAPTHEDQMVKILEVYLDIFPVLDSNLLRYSPLGFLGEGIISLDETGLKNIREERDDIRTLPVIFSAIIEKKAKFCTGIEYFKQTSSRYIFPSTVSSLLVVPIFINTVVIGYILSVSFPEDCYIDDHLLSCLTLFGELVGKVVMSSNKIESLNFLSKREAEVMTRIAQGESSKEMAKNIGISEFTIKQYVKSALKKLGAQNRAQAVAELFRRGIIS